MKFLNGLGTAVVAVLALTGCGDGSAGSTAVSAKVAQPPAARPSIGKPRPPVQVLLVEGPSLEAGVPGELTLQVRSRVALEAVDLVVEGDEGLALVTVTALPVTVTSDASRRLPAGEAARFEIATTPTSGGTRHLSGLLSFEVNGVRQGVPFSLPVRVSGPVTLAPVAAKPERTPVRDSTGELIDSMPAETTVR